MKAIWPNGAMPANGTQGEIQAMSTVETTGTNETIRTARPGRGRKAKGASSAKKVLKLSLSTETIAVLQLHALKDGASSVSAYTESMILRHCNSWIIHAKPGPKPEA